MPARGLKVAPPWRRFAAAAIDTLVVGIPTIAGAIGANWLWMVYQRRRGRHATGMPTLDAGRRWSRTLAAVASPLAVQARNWRSPGYRALGLRRVDARTGGQVTLRSAIIRAAATGLWSQVTRSLVRPWQTRQADRLKAIQAEVRHAQRAHEHDREGANRALREIYKRENVNPMSSCVPVVISAAIPQLSALWPPRHQTLPDRLAGIVVVLDDRGTPPAAPQRMRRAA